MTSANEPMAKIHDRMPVIVAREDCLRWLSAELTDPEEIAPMLAPYPA